MKRFLTSRPFKFAVGMALFLLLTLVACAAYFRIWSWQDLAVYMAMARDCHPVWKQLHSGRIHAGQDLEEVIAVTHPLYIDRNETYARIGYQPRNEWVNVTIIAKHGRLIKGSAESSTWSQIFFNEMTEDDWYRLREADEAHWRPFLKKP